MNKATVVKYARLVGMWLPAILLLLIFLPAGWSKFSDTSGWSRAFRHWGYPDWFRILIGVLEIGGALALFWPRIAIGGALLIIAIMLGGTATHLLKDNGRHLTSEIVPIFLSTVLILSRRSASKPGARTNDG